MFPVDLSFGTSLLTTDHEDNDTEAFKHEQTIRAKQVIRMVTDRFKETQRAYKHQFDKRHPSASFRVGDLVLLEVPHLIVGQSTKLARPWKGPYRVRALIQEKDILINVEVISVANPDDIQRVHVSRLIHFYSDFDDEQQAQQDENMFEIEEIVDERMQNGQKEFLVKWKGYTKKFNSWVS